MTTPIRASAICLLAAVGCQTAGARDETRPPPKPAPPARTAQPAQPMPSAPPSEPPPPVRFERDMVVRFHMHESYDLVRAIEKLLLRGNLEDARAFAQAIAEAPDEPGLAAWAKQAAIVRERAGALAAATTIDEACRREARLAAACAGCHVDAGASPDFRSRRPAPPDHPTLEARMARHQWAAGRLWEGIVGGADDSWREGLAVLAATPLPAPQLPRTDLARRLQQLADQAQKRRSAEPLDERARVYGELLGICAGCHAARPAERAGGGGP